jgi:thioredoxin-dependent peroxiredoxin
MSTKSRKKSSKTSTRRPARAKSSKAAKTRGKQTGRAATSKSAGKATSGPSHTAASKRLRSSDAAARSKAAAKKVAKKAAKKASSKKGSAVEKSQAPGGSVTEGAKAPAFRLPRDGGAEIALSDFAGKKLVLFFYPRADTPGCTREAIDFSRLSRQFAESGTEVVGVSGDPVKAQDSFRDKHKLAVPLISDQQHAMLEAYGAWGEKSMYGKTFHGIIRTTVLIGSDGRIARIWRKVKVDGHADAVLEAARAL